MPKAKTKSKYNHPDEPNWSIDIAVDTFLETGHFTLTNERVTTEVLIYFTEYLKKQPKPSPELDYKFYLENVTFSLEIPTLSSQEEFREATIGLFLNQVFSCSHKWRVIAFDNVSILQDKNYYPLSLRFILLFLARFKISEDDLIGLSVTNALIITNARFHPWAWIRFLTNSPRFDRLTLELLLNEEQEDNIMVLCEALHYAKIKILNFGNTKINVEGYQALYELLDKNYFIEKMQLKEPTDPAAFTLFKKINERLPAGRTGKQRFDIERFNQAEFLRLFFLAKNALKYELDDKVKIRQLENEIEFLLEEKNLLFNICITHRKNLLELAPAFYAVYLDHAEYIHGRLPLFRLDLNQLVDNEKRTLGYYLLEDALEKNDFFMMSCLINKGRVNLLEQRGDEKPLVMQIFDKNKDFKGFLLRHIFYDKILVRKAEQVLQNYSKAKEIMVNMSYSLINYAEILEQRLYPYQLSESVRLLNLLKDIARLSRPSKQRDQEFIEIYFRLYKCLTLFHNAEGRVTVESISHVQNLLTEIGTISRNADWGWKVGSQLHRSVNDQLNPLWETLREIKQLAEKDHMIDEKDKVIAQQAGTIRDMTKKNIHLTIKVTLLEREKMAAKATHEKEKAEYEAERQQFKATLAAMQAQLEMVTKDPEPSSEQLNKANPSPRFFSRS